MKHIAPCLMILLASLAFLAKAAPCRGGLVSEHWGAAGAPCTHPDTLKVVLEGKTTRLALDLSAMPEGAKVHHASLFCFTRDGRQPRMPAVIQFRDGPAAPISLKLESPWYRSFDATEAVKRRAEARGGERASLTFRVESFDGLEPTRSYLEVRYEGAARPVGMPEQIEGLRAVHHEGQTFLVWKEAKALRPPADGVLWVEKFSRKGNKIAKDPGTGWGGLPRVPAITLKTLRELQGVELRDKPSGFQGIGEARRVRKTPQVRYRIYRHGQRITPRNLAEAEIVGEGLPLSAYDQKMAVIAFKGEYIDQREVGESIIPTSCVQDGKPVMAGEAIYVHTPARAGKSYYAVTVVLDGTENASDVTPANSLIEPVAESRRAGTAGPRPVLQRLQEIDPRSNVIERWHLFWPAPPYANLPAAPPLHVLVGEPRDAQPPLPMIIDGFHGGFNIVEALRVPSTTALTLLIEHQTAWGGDGDLLYNEGRGTLRSYAECKVDYFSERYFLRMVDWAMSAWKIDRAKVFGGQHDSGPLHVGVRHPEIFRRIFLGDYTASYVYTWSPPSNGLAEILGPRDLARTTDGHNAWDVLDLAWYLRQDPGRDIPLVMCSSGTGKDTGHTSEFGWQDDPRGWAALLAARQPFLAAWSTGGDDPGGQQRVSPVQPEVAAMFQKIRWDATIPAFGHCSLDNNPGSGDPSDGDSCGQINGYLIWDNSDSTDSPQAWEMTVWLVDTCPEDSCTVDVTPRHCRSFKPRDGQRFNWTNTSVPDGKVIQSGTVTADRWGLVTLKGVKVQSAKKGRNRIVIQAGAQ